MPIIIHRMASLQCYIDQGSPNLLIRRTFPIPVTLLSMICLIAPNLRGSKFRESLQISVKVIFHDNVISLKDFRHSMLSRPFPSEYVI